MIGPTTLLAAMMIPPTLPPPPPPSEETTKKMDFSCKLHSKDGAFVTKIDVSLEYHQDTASVYRKANFVANLSNDIFQDFDGIVSIDQRQEPKVTYSVARSISLEDTNDQTRRIFTFNFADWKFGYAYFVIKDVVRDRMRVNELNSIGMCFVES